MFNQQALVSQLYELGQKDHAKRLMKDDVDAAVKEFLDRLKKTSIDPALLDQKFKDNLQKAYEDEYRELTKTHEEKKQEELEKEQQKKQKKEHEEAEKKKKEFYARIKKCNEASDDAIDQLDNAVDAAYEAVFAYCKEFRSRVDQSIDASPFEDHLKAFRDAAAQPPKGAVPPERREIMFAKGELVGVTSESCEAVLVTPLGDFPRIGALRAGLLELADKSVADLSASAPARNTPEFSNAVSGSVFVALRVDGTHPQIARRVGAWLQADGVGISPDRIPALAASRQWTLAAALSRTASLLLQAWRARLREMKLALDIARDILAVRNERHQKLKPLEPETIFKELREVCKKDLAAVMAARIPYFEKGILESKIEVEKLLQTLDIAQHFTSEPSKEQLKVTLTNEIPNKIANQVRSTFKKLFVDAEAAFSKAWEEHILERIVLYHLGRNEKKPFLQGEAELVKNIRSEAIVPPVPGEIANADLEEDLEQFLQRTLREEFSTPVVNSRNLKAIYQGVGKLPGRLLAYLGPIFAISMLLGFGGAGAVRNLFPTLMQQLELNFGSELPWMVLAGVFFLVCMIGGTFVSLIRRQQAERLAFADVVRIRLADMHARMSQDLQKRYLEIANKRIERSVADVLRKVRVHFDLHLAEKRAEWESRLRALKRDRERLDSQVDALSDLVSKDMGDALKEVDSVQKDLRKLAHDTLLKL